ncbi:MAG TPA: polysaccharide biosynthesis/export family protein [Candidatus Acidoferrum sp.]|nr:polysaccharide biosynthesis/export family protein [Candidatus Acidoferrum sp.]
MLKYLGKFSVVLLSGLAATVLASTPSAAFAQSSAAQTSDSTKPGSAATSSQTSKDKDTSASADAKTRTEDHTNDSDADVPPDLNLKTYHIGIADELMISVWKEPELSNQVVVRPDGKITLPLINEISVVGLRTDELQDLLTQKFKPFVNTPQVTVIVRSIRSRKVSLVGNVGHQGTFSLNDEKTILELLAEAGGLGPFAKSNGIYILRQAGNKKIRIPFDYKKAISGKGPNPVLQPGDLVVVP